MAILNDVLDHSKIEAGKLELTTGSVSLRAVAASVVGLFRSNAEAKGVLLLLDVDPDTPEWVIGDGQRLKQVLLNLVGNAIKFTESGTVTLELHAATSDGERVRVAFEVRDTGIGISPEELTTVFEPFHQVGGARKRRGGTGLGLAISQRIVEAMAGRIEVRSTPGQGSQFIFVVPFERDPEPPTQPVEDSLHGSLDEPGRLSGTVLVVEDNEVNRLIATEMLMSLGLQVLEAEDGLAALEVLSRQPVDLVLMDVQMPVMDGVTATFLMRGAGYGGPIVALTANVMRSDIEQYRGSGCDDVLGKPIDRAKLYAVLSRYLRPAGHTAPQDRALDEVLERLGDRFRADLPQTIVQLEQALAGERWAEVGTMTHQIKGLAGSVGLPDLTAQAAPIDALIATGRHDEARARCHALLEAMNHVAHALEPCP
jgi:CheY-like chemotaxis protein